MAKYYYERYSIVSTTTWSWNKYNNRLENRYSLSDFGNRFNYGDRDSHTAYAGYNYLVDDGICINTGGQKTIYPGGTGYVYSSSGNTVERFIFSTTPGNKFLYSDTASTYVSSTVNKKGSLVATLTGLGYSAYPNNELHWDGYWYVRGSSGTINSKGSYVDTIVAEQGTYPANGISGDYWYVLKARAFPEFAVRDNGQLGTAIDGWVRVDGQLKQIQGMWVRVNGQLKEI